MTYSLIEPLLYPLIGLSKMLRNIQTYIADHGTVSITELGMYFHADCHALTPMLKKLIRKGRIRQLSFPEKCTDCTCCDFNDLELYEWVEKTSDSTVKMDDNSKLQNSTFIIHDQDKKIRCFPK